MDTWVWVLLFVFVFSLALAYVAYTQQPKESKTIVEVSKTTPAPSTEKVSKPSTEKVSITTPPSPSFSFPKLEFPKPPDIGSMFKFQMPTGMLNI